MTTYACKPYHMLRDGQKTTIVDRTGRMQKVKIESATDAMRVWTFREARKMYGWRGYCHSVRLARMQQVGEHGRLLTFEVCMARRAKAGEPHQAQLDQAVVYAVD